MEKYLTETEISKIESFVADETMFEAVRKVLLQGLYLQGTVQMGVSPDPLKNGAFSLVSLALENPIPDEVLGQNLRAQWAGVNALHNALKDLKNIKTVVKDVETPYNEAV